MSIPCLNVRYLICLFFSAIVLIACKKDSFTTSPAAQLTPGADTLYFDTVFTSAGSVTQSFRLVNNNDQKIRISRIALAGGALSPFKINIDGASGPEAENVVINANDSLYIFVQVNVNPSAAELPFIIEDSIGISYNGNSNWVQLRAYGQNAVFLKNEVISGNASWNSTLPYVISGGLQVAAGATLHITEGTKIYLHANASFIVDGSLQVSGTKDAPVIFSGDRLDKDYKDLPASWPGIYFRTQSENNSFTHCIIKNAYQGIIAQGLPSTAAPKVRMSQCIIQNIYDAGILGINTSLAADNCLVSNCGANIQLALGGDYAFTNCTVASYNTLYLTRENPVLQVSDNYSEGGSTYISSLNASFTNCIFWGSAATIEDEVIVSRKGEEPFAVSFDHVLYKAKNDIPLATFASSLKNEDPLFDTINVSKNIFDFHTGNPLSPVIKAGIAVPFMYDLDDKVRNNPPDIGCYEK